MQKVSLKMINGGQELKDSVDQFGTQLADMETEVDNRVKGKDVVTNAQGDGPNTTMGHPTNKIADDVSTSVILGGGRSNSGYNNIIGGDGSSTVNTSAPNTTTPGTGAHVSVVGGYDNVAGSLSSKIISDHSYTEVGGDGHNAIYGGANHVIKSTASFATIAGGFNNKVGGKWAFATGGNNKAMSTSSFAGGNDNEITGVGGVAFGSQNKVLSSFGLTQGVGNEVNNAHSSVLGLQGRSKTSGQHVISNGSFSTIGDAQTSVIIGKVVTTTDSQTPIPSTYVLPINSAVTFHCLIVGFDINDPTGAVSIELKGLMLRGTGSSVISSMSNTNLGSTSSSSAWSATVTGGSAGDLTVRVTGQANKTIRWVTRLTLVEVAA